MTSERQTQLQGQRQTERSTTMIDRIPTTKVVIFGESGVGKTCFSDMFVMGTHYSTWAIADQAQNHRPLLVDDTWHKLDLLDVNSSLFHGPLDPNFNSTLYNDFLARARGIALLYDITSRKSYEDITTKGYWCVYQSRFHTAMVDPAAGNRVAFPCPRQRFGCVLVGTKKDLVRQDSGKREVDEEVAREWADSQGIPFFEVDTDVEVETEDAMRALVGDIRRKEERDAEDVQTERNRLKESKERRFRTIKGAFR
ncbi:P-loop containing nucleoside triphosphate hydrolase protein [Pleomassaria siparia CBS 279.74]|uniref:P-loop containing nucleoside triphosphate hydrolase protein n=1 Tax=Pleomassaria siparia CBS 279.74 TaxID=1314801 RepID=A0A6G1KP65_9PLEO|nr:P-loop containing nucleoside triphosphate hydrolase protein [Pleomassaria siparia CBS 279.74]